ncbi:MAG TPA: transposase [Ardenticatenaceae bacterium]|jgi:REP element-mobilizing transposase RayT
MEHNPPPRHRRSIRLPGYNYAQAGIYFVTICTLGRECLFGAIEEAGAEDADLLLSEFGEVAWKCWQEIPSHFPRVELDSFVVMPNHVHGILIFDEKEITLAESQPDLTLETFGRPVPESLPTVIRSYKSATTQRINSYRETPGQKVWQRNYYEQIIRNDEVDAHSAIYCQ